MFYTTDELIAAAKRNSMVPMSQNTFSDDDLIAFANEMLMTKLVPHILSVRQDFFLARKTVPIRANVDHYGLTERAIGNSLKDLFYLPDASDSSVKRTLPSTQVHAMQEFTGTGEPRAFYIQGDEVVILPKPTAATGALMTYFFHRPNKLVATSSCAKITGVSSAGGTTIFTVDSDLTGSLSNGEPVDFLNSKSPFMLWASDVVITAITSTEIHVATADVSDEGDAIMPAVGDYICPAQTANIPMIPQEFHPILAEMVGLKIMKALGAIQNLQAVQATITDMLNDAFKMIANRVESEVDTVYDPNGLLNCISGPSF